MRQLHKDTRLCLPHLADAPTKTMVTAPLTLILPMTLVASQMTLEMKGLVKLAPAFSAHGGTRRLTLGITVDSNHGKAREGPFPKCQALARVNGAKLWALVQSRYQSQVSELGLESLTLV